jgi:hypothetical protein
MLEAGVPGSFALWGAAVLIVGIRVLAWRGDWRIK